MDRFLSSGSLSILLLSGLAASLLPKPEDSQMLFTLLAATGGLAGYWLGGSTAIGRANVLVRFAICVMAVLCVPALGLIYYNFIELPGPAGLRAYLAWAAMAGVIGFVTFFLRVVDDIGRTPPT